ncbi:MAG: DUF4177 domain-containing protein [Canibacter sp.]
MDREYTFHRISVSRSREGSTPTEDYRDVIRQHAALGWKFEQIVQFDTQQPPHIDVVFSRERKAQ